MKKILCFIFIGYFITSILWIIYLNRLLFLPNPAYVVNYFSLERRNEFLEIADYMRTVDISSYNIAAAPTDPNLEAMMESCQLDKVEFLNSGVVVYGAFRGRMRFEYHYGENIRVHVKDLKSKFPDWTYFRIDDHWHFVSNRTRR